MALFLSAPHNVLLSVSVVAAALLIPSLVVSSSTSDMLIIRHGRSRVRHSNEKDHIRWGLQAFDNLTLDDYEDGYDNETGLSSGSGAGSGGSQLFGSEFWLNSDTNGSYANQTNIFSSILQSLLTINVSLAETTPPLTTTAPPPTGKRKKIHKKKIMENIRKNVDKGLEYLKSHKDLDENLSRIQEDVVGQVSSTTTTVPPQPLPRRPELAEYETSLQSNNHLHNESHPPEELLQQDEGMDYDLGIEYGPSHSASTSVGGIGLDQSDDASTVGVEEAADSDADGLVEADEDEANNFLAGAVDGALEEEVNDWDETSRENRRNLMRGRDVVTKFLQIVETQHLLGSNCEAGTSLNLGEGVVDRYAQDRFRVEAEVAVNRANMLTRIFKTTNPSVQASVNLLHASVLSMVEFDDDIFAAGNCFDWNQHPAHKGLFCPFAYRLPAPNHGALIAKDLATEYHYLGNTSEWFFLARKNAEKVIARNDQYMKSFHVYSNRTEEKIEEDTLAVRYEDGRWSKPYYDCGGGNIWMLTYTVPFFGYENGTYLFKGTSGIDIDLRRVDIDQCPQRNNPGSNQPLNIFAGTDKCKQRTTMCEALNGLGFRRGSYKCVCRKGFYFPETTAAQKYFNGSVLEEEYEKLMLGSNSTYNVPDSYTCLPCAEGCDYCEDGSPCIAALNWPMRTSILVLACAVIGLLPPAAWFTFRYQQVKVVRAASPALLRVIALGAFFIYCTTILMYPNPSLYTCTARIWFRELGFSLTYGALMLKTWRISVIFQVRSAKTVKISDGNLLKRLGVICGVIGTFLLVRTLVSPPDVVVGRTADDLKAFLCKTDWWDYTFTSMEVLFLAWGVRLCIMVRKAPSEFNESRFISMAIYNEFLLTCFLNVSMLFLQSPANPDLLYIIFFCHTQLTVTLLLGLIFGSKVYIVMRSGKVPETINMGPKSSGAKFNFRPNARTFANPSSATTSTAQLGCTATPAETKMSDHEALEEIRQLSIHLQRIQELAPAKGVAVMTISSLLEGLKSASHQLGTKPPVSLNNEIQKLQQNNNNGSAMAAPTTRAEKSINTSMSGEEFLKELLQLHPQTKCASCANREPTAGMSCQQMGSPLPEGSISFSDLKMDCMCSQPDHLDSVHPPGGHKSHSSNNLVQSKLKRNASPRSTSSSFCDKHKHSNQFVICDNCKSKLSSRNCRSSELLEVSVAARATQTKTKSTDDVSFCTTTDDDTDNDKGAASTVSSSSSSGQSVVPRKRRTDKLVLDLNDRSKYTKEVSV